MPEANRIEEHDLDLMVGAGAIVLTTVRASTCSPECAALVLAVALSKIIEEWNLPPAGELVDFAKTLRTAVEPRS